MKIMYLCAFLALFGCGCATTELVDIHNDKGGPSNGLEYRDFEYAADSMLQNMIEMGSLNKPGGGRYVVAVSRVKNDTMQNIDTDQLTKKLRKGLLKSGKAVVSNAKDEAMVNKSSGNLIEAELALSGKILERQVKMNGSKKQFEYYFMLTLTNVQNGLAYFEDEQLIVKRGKGSSN